MAIESLEGRTLLATSVVDPTFNSGQAIITPAALTSPISANSNNAVAVQADGKIVVAGQASSSTSPSGTTFQVAVQRYNVNGTLDTTFGTAGQTLVAVPEGAANGFSVIHSMLVQTDGGIVLGLNLTTSTGTTANGVSPAPVGSDLIRLTAAGALDASFGTGGIVTMTTSAPSFVSLVLQSDGKILLNGLAMNPKATPANTPTDAVTRLNTDGSFDSTFNGGSLLILPLFNAAPGLELEALGASGIGLTTTGKIKLVTNFGTLQGKSYSDFGVVQLNTDGTYDTTYGANGLTLVPNTTIDYLATAAVLPSGSVVLGLNTLGSDVNTSNLLRLNADGSLDIAFGSKNLPFVINSLQAAPDGSLLVGGGETIPYGAFETYPAVELARLTSAGQLDSSFAPGGLVSINLPTVGFGPFSYASVVAANGVALTADGRIVVAGTATFSRNDTNLLGQTTVVPLGSQAILSLVRPVNHLAGFNGDYDGDNKSDIAAVLADLGAFAYRKSTGGDVVQPFGASGLYQSIPAPGDYDGDGITDVAAYLPAYGVLAYRPSSGGKDQLIRFGPTGSGAAIPVPGDYDGDGRTDVALFVPSQALYLIDPSGGGTPYAVQFGAAGLGQSIPVPGDYNGSGRTELAVYLPALGELIYRQTYTTTDTPIQFGPPGLGASIPFAGDYDGDGKTDLALYLPASGTFAVSPYNGANYAVQFGAAGTSASLPISGDFDGDGKDDLAVYLPAFGDFAYRPSGGGTDVVQPFGTGGATTMPASALPDLALDRTVSILAVRSADPTAGLVFYLPDDLPTTKTRRNPTA